MTIHYHGGPIWGDKEVSYHELMKALWREGGALVSYAHPSQLKHIVNIKCKIVFDCGAFSDWNKDRKNHVTRDWDKHWAEYYDKFVGPWFSRIEWFIIPDDIEGGEEENNKLIAEVPPWLISKGVPVWHSEESIERFIMLCSLFPRVAIGCMGRQKSIRSKAWFERMTECFTEIYVKRNLPVKIHGLRMLDGRALSQFPFDSDDSSSVATNVPKTDKVVSEIKCKLARTAILRAAKDMVKPPTVQEWVSGYWVSKMSGLK